MIINSTHNVTDLSVGDRRSLEGLLGSPLGDGQQVVLMVIPPAHEGARSSGLLRRFKGKVRSGDPRAADNDRIDIDLARAYGDTHAE